MISRSVASLLVLFALPIGSAVADDLVVYDDQLRNGFQDWSWAEHDLAATNPVFDGTRSIRFEPDDWEGLYFSRNGAGLNFADYSALSLRVRGGGAGGQSLRIVIQNGSSIVANLSANAYLDGGGVAADAWRELRLPFDAGTGLVAGSFDGVILQDGSGGDQAGVYVDAIVLVENGTPPPPGEIAIAIHTLQDRRPVNPHVFGVNFGSDAQHADLRYPVRRWGGNSTTRYHWQADVHNTGDDWFYQNIVDGDGENLPDGSTVNAFFDGTRLHGGEPVLTVPTIGWVPTPQRVKKWSFSQAAYGTQDLDECRYFGPDPPAWCTADSGNGRCSTSGNPTPFCQGGFIVGNNPLDTSIAIGPDFVGDWVQYLATRYGGATNGGLRFYALDNEFSLWHHTHRDVRPDPVGYDELWQRMRDYAAAIKAADSAAQTFGPVTWGWCDLFFSPLDGGCANGPDRQAHGNLPLIAWVLQRNCAHPLPGGRRVIDYLDVHYYPQGGVALSDDESAALAAQRLRSLRELYDPTYVSESWINQPVALVPQLRQWIDQYCPGTRIALTEYNWGGDSGLSSALAQVEALAIFAREGVDLATRWVAPADGSKLEESFRLFLDYDGADGRVAGDSVRATSPDIDRVGAYAVHDAGGGRLFVVLINKSLEAQTATLSFDTAIQGGWTLYGLDGAGAYGPRDDGVVAGTQLVLPPMPARSARLLVLPLGDVLFADGFEAP